MMVGLSSLGTRWHGALIQEGPPLVFLAGVLPECVWHRSLVYVAPASPVSVLTLKNGAAVTGVTPR
jgi:hypothetical protein